MDNVSLAAEALLSHLEGDLEKRILTYWALHKQFVESFYADTDLSLKFGQAKWKLDPGTRIRWFVRRVTEDNDVERGALAQMVVKLISLPA